MHSWDIYRIKGTPAAFIGIVEAPTAEAAIERAIEEFNIKGKARLRLIARRARVDVRASNELREVAEDLLRKADELERQRLSQK
jgi:gamma-glutamylcysteine synthetase